MTLKGKIDGILGDPLSADYFWEHKSINHFGFQRYLGGDVFPEDNLAQCAIYMRALHADLPDLAGGLLLLKNKNQSAFLEYELHYDIETDTLEIPVMRASNGDMVKTLTVREHIVEMAVMKFNAVQDHAEAGTLPVRPYQRGSDWQCDYCAYATTCWQGYADELDAISAEAELEPELADKVRYHQQLGAEIKEQETERKGIAQELKQVMLDRKLKVGRVGEYEVRLQVQTRTKLDEENLPADLAFALKQHKTSYPVSFVKVSKLKEK